MGTTVKDILIAARAKLATVAPSRDGAQFFLEHKSNQPFETSPKSKRDGFEIVERDFQLTSAFGVAGEKEAEFDMVTRLGHAPFGTDDEREEFRVQDVTRIADIFESFAWPTGTSIVLFHRAETDKKNPNWWITEMFFKVVYTGAIQS